MERSGIRGYVVFIFPTLKGSNLYSPASYVPSLCDSERKVSQSSAKLRKDSYSHLLCVPLRILRVPLCSEFFVWSRLCRAGPSASSAVNSRNGQVPYLGRFHVVQIRPLRGRAVLCVSTPGSAALHPGLPRFIPFGDVGFDHFVPGLHLFSLLTERNRNRIALQFVLRKIRAEARTPNILCSCS